LPPNREPWSVPSSWERPSRVQRLAHHRSPRRMRRRPHPSKRGVRRPPMRGEGDEGRRRGRKWRRVKAERGKEEEEEQERTAASTRRRRRCFSLTILGVTAASSVLRMGDGRGWRQKKGGHDFNLLKERRETIPIASPPFGLALRLSLRSPLESSAVRPCIHQPVEGGRGIPLVFSSCPYVARTACCSRRSLLMSALTTSSLDKEPRRFGMSRLRKTGAGPTGRGKWPRTTRKIERQNMSENNTQTRLLTRT